MSDDNCLDASQHDGPIKLVRCHGMGGNQAWVYNEKVGYIYYLESVSINYCLVVADELYLPLD